MAARRIYQVSPPPPARNSWAVLICEDLARQEPAAELIRAVGSNLVIALLMDGPQLNNRWPARYAAVGLSPHRNLRKAAS